MTSGVARVLELEARRCRFLESGNIEAIDALLDTDLIYVHATGVIHDRRQWLEFLHTAARFKSVERRGLHGLRFQEVILVTGLMRIQGERMQTGEVFESRSFVSQAWTLQADGAWKLRLFQSTKMDDALWNQMVASTAGA